MLDNAGAGVQVSGRQISQQDGNRRHMNGVMVASPQTGPEAPQGSQPRTHTGNTLLVFRPDEASASHSYANRVCSFSNEAN